MNQITTKPSLSRPVPPKPAFTSSPLFHRLHLGLTAVLLVGFVAILALAAAGSVRFGKAAPDAPGKEKDVAGKKSDSDGTKADGEKAGRYQIELADDASHITNEMGKLGMLGDRVREAWVYRYRGGFLECKLETDFGGKAVSSGQVPDWSRLQGSLDESKDGKPEGLYKEGFLVVTSMIPTVSVEQALEPFAPHLGAMFNPGPAGPLHALIPFSHEVWRRREYRLFLSASPPKGKTGGGFHIRSGDFILIRSHFLADETEDPPARTLTGKNFDPGQDLILLEQPRALSVVRLKARFLTDAEVIEKANAKPQ